MTEKKLDDDVTKFVADLNRYKLFSNKRERVKPEISSRLTPKKKKAYQFGGIEKGKILLDPNNIASYNNYVFAHGGGSLPDDSSADGYVRSGLNHGDLSVDYDRHTHLGSEPHYGSEPSVD